MTSRCEKYQTLFLNKQSFPLQAHGCLCELHNMALTLMGYNNLSVYTKCILAKQNTQKRQEISLVT